MNKTIFVNSGLTSTRGDCSRITAQLKDLVGVPGGGGGGESIYKKGRDARREL